MHLEHAMASGDNNSLHFIKSEGGKINTEIGKRYPLDLYIHYIQNCIETFLTRHTCIAQYGHDIVSGKVE